jgi:hypothetical protein
MCSKCMKLRLVDICCRRVFVFARNQVHTALAESCDSCLGNVVVSAGVRVLLVGLIGHLMLSCCSSNQIPNRDKWTAYQLESNTLQRHKSTSRTEISSNNGCYSV